MRKQKVPATTRKPNDNTPKKQSGGSSSTPKYRKIEIKGTRGATITINGTRISEKTPHTMTNGDIGRYTFVITKDGFEPFTKTVNTSMLGIYTVNANLTEKATAQPEKPSGNAVSGLVVATNEDLTSVITNILNEDDDPESEGATSGIAGGIAGGSGLNQDGLGLAPDEQFAAGQTGVDEQAMSEELRENETVKRVVKITEIVNDDTLTAEERSSLLDCYRMDDGSDKGSVQSPKTILDRQNQSGNTGGTLKTGKLNSGAGNSLNQIEVIKLLDKNSEESYGNTLGDGYADFDMKYNYVSYEFEDYVLATSPPVARLPSFANFINLGDKDVAGVNEQSMGSLVYPENSDGTDMLPREPRTYFGTLLTRPEDHKFAHFRLEDRSAGSVSIYYNELFTSLQQAEIDFSNHEHLNKNYIFHEPFVAKMKEKNYLKRHFPVYVNIEISSYKSFSYEAGRDKSEVTIIADILKDNNMQGMFLNTVMATSFTVPDEVEQDQEGKPVKIWNDLEINSDNFLVSPYSADNSIHFYGHQKQESNLDAGSYDAALRQVPESGGFIDETIMYKVTKYLKGSPDPIQNFFFFNDSKAGPIEFVDTQLNIAESYEYRVFAYNIRKFGLQTHTVQLVEYETFHQDDVYVVSRPPMPPDVTIAPYMGNERNVLFLFNDSSGKALLEPITLGEEDLDRLSKIQKIYGRKIPDPGLPAEKFVDDNDYYLNSGRNQQFKNFIEYEYDGSSIFFEVYRTTTPPNGYGDFTGKRIARTTGTSFKDDIPPNTKHYYTFRCMDNHGNFSNPSMVFEVEIVKTFNVFPNIRVYDFPDEIKETRETKRNMKRFLRIIPDTKFMFVRETAGNPDYTLGPDNIAESLWGKKFKLRMTSKTTGKKIDFNFSFTKSFIGNT